MQATLLSCARVCAVSASNDAQARQGEEGAKEQEAAQTGACSVWPGEPKLSLPQPSASRTKELILG